MKILVATLGRFHMFDLARGLRNKGEQPHILTTTPRMRVDSDLQTITNSFSRWAILERARMRLPIARKSTWWQDEAIQYAGRCYAEWVARHPRQVDVMDALAGVGLEAGRVLHSLGIPWVVNRSSTHLLHQKRILEEEYFSLGLPPPIITSRQGLARALAEYEEADAVVVPSEYCRNTFLERGISAQKLHRCTFGVDLSIYTHRGTPPQNIFRICFVGAYSIRKGIHYLFDAIRPLVQSRICECWLIGAPQDEARSILAQNSDLFIDKGFFPRVELPKLYSASHVLVLPSLEEGLPLVVPQAIACGTPVIVSEATGAADIITNGVEGFIVPCQDSRAIREKIQWMVDNPVAREEMSMACLARTQSMSGWGQYTDAALNVYTTLLKKDRKPSSEPHVNTAVQQRRAIS
jgi:alpha-maltose-1-phosphate synthase